MRLWWGPETVSRTWISALFAGYDGGAKKSNRTDRTLANPNISPILTRLRGRIHTENEAQLRSQCVRNPRNLPTSPIHPAYIWGRPPMRTDVRPKSRTDIWQIGGFFNDTRSHCQEPEMSHPIWTQMSTKYSLYAVGSRIHNAYGWGQNLHVEHLCGQIFALFPQVSIPQQRETPYPSTSVNSKWVTSQAVWEIDSLKSLYEIRSHVFLHGSTVSRPHFVPTWYIKELVSI